MIGSILQHDYRAVLCMLVSNVLIELILVADSLLLIYIKKKLNSEHVKVQINVFHIYTQYFKI